MIDESEEKIASSLQGFFQSDASGSFIYLGLEASESPRGSILLGDVKLVFVKLGSLVSCFTLVLEVYNMKREGYYIKKEERVPKTALTGF